MSFGRRESCTSTWLLFVPCGMSEEQEQEQSVCIKFCVKLGRNGAETYEMLRTAFVEQCLSRARIFEWHKRFKEGRDSVDDNPRSGRPTTSKTDDCLARVRELIQANQRLTIRDLSDEVGGSYETCQAMLTQDLKMRRVAAKFVPRILTAEQKEWRLSVATNMLQEAVRWKLYGANHHGRRDVGLRVWPEDETSVLAVEVCWFPEVQESAPGAVKSQSHAHCFLWYGGHCSLLVRSTRPNCKPAVLSTSLETSETCCFSQEDTETGGEGLGAPSRQCTSTHSTFHPGIFGKSWHSCHSATTLLPWHGSLWLLVVPPIKNSVAREEIWRHWHN